MNDTHSLTQRKSAHLVEDGNMYGQYHHQQIIHFTDLERGETLTLLLCTAVTEVPLCVHPPQHSLTYSLLKFTSITPHFIQITFICKTINNTISTAKKIEFPKVSCYRNQVKRNPVHFHRHFLVFQEMLLELCTFGGI